MYGDFSISPESLEQVAAGDIKKRPAPLPEPEAPVNSPAQEQAERDVIRTYMAFPILFLKTYERLNPELVQTAEFRLIYEKSIQQFEDDLVFLPEKLLSYIDNSEQAGRVAEYMHADVMDEEQAEAVNRESVRFILLKNYEREEIKLKAQYMQAESAGDEIGARKFVSLLDIIQKQKHALVR
ncbi:hypothetical protein ACFL4W_05400 [Planctomycetota bacterium]